MLFVRACGVVVLSIVPLFLLVGKSFIPNDDQSQFTVNVRLPEGTSLAETKRYTEEVAAHIRRRTGVRDTLSTIGGGRDGAANAGSIFVRLADLSERQDSAESIAAQTRTDLLKIRPDNVFIGVVTSTMGGGGGADTADVQYYIQGPDLAKLTQYSQRILTRAKSIPGFADVDSSMRSGRPEVKLAIDRDRAADLGVSVQDIQQSLNMLVAGQTATTFNTGGDQYDVTIRASDRYRGTAEGLHRLRVPSSRLGSVELSAVTKSVTGAGPSTIRRLGRERIVNITGNLLPGVSQAAVVSSLDSMIDDLHLGPEYQGGATGMTRELGSAGYYFALAFSLAFIFMYIVLAAQFESFIHPITILITLPLAVPFGIIALLLTHQQVNIFSGLGLLLLFGIVKKNAILQIDHTNGLRAKGAPRYDAIIQANRDRLRPILMTTLALVFGMLPLLISSGAGAATNRSIAVLVAGGQTLCLLLTLLAVPVFYSLWEDLADWLRCTRLGRMFGGVKSESTTAGILQGELQ